jgi:hypothetical protein
MMKTTLLSKSFILELCAPKPPPQKTVSPQLLLEGFLLLNRTAVKLIDKK